MINIELITRPSRKFCCEDLSLVENYDNAINDKTQTWHCHHRLEIQGDKIFSIKDLISQGLYYNRPASELIFLTKSEHMKLHSNNMSETTKQKISNSQKGKIQSEESNKKRSESLKGEKSYWYGKHLANETKEKISNSKKGKSNGPRDEITKQKISNTLKGKVFSEEHKRKISEACKGRIPWNKGKGKQNEDR